ncbi:MAG: DNA mismatch repair protein [Euryarchaeota archaeon ADurb.BinA087]|nr:MAG: DNA mismatch repair protein [Euryarchaeota archaeon ADurb.BinA087]HQA80315.1 DNA mismatch repair endonuclease MutL [Methanoregulaceae archaeon]
MTPDQGSRIRVLDEGTVSRISAGEVVERAASVVKELCENSIDAGAVRIRVAVRSEKGRITSIQVSDDGCGMSPDDARLAFARYATSKIACIDDLFACSTLGFRGEALASIAAVAKVTIVTKSRQGTGISGTQIVNQGGEFLLVSETGCPFGTVITVEQLFFNTPAREKFQKTLSTEIARITGIIERLVITHPGIAFELTHNDRKILSVPGGGILMDTIIHLFGLPVSRQMIRVHADNKGIFVDGYISVPELSRKNQYQMFISVNRRSISSRILSNAVREAYGTLLPAGRYPVVFLDLSIAPSEVDVNVHPTKREVRLSREEEVRKVLISAISESLGGASLIPEAGATGDSVSGAEHPGRIRYRVPELGGETGVREPLLRERISTERQISLTGRQPDTSVESKLPDFEIIGQLGSLYILAGTPGDDLLVIDQHAAHERVLYEQVTEYAEQHHDLQELLEPVVLSFSPGESEALSASLPLLAEEGFCIDAFGPGTFLVRTVPVLLGQSIEPGEIRDIIAGIIAPGMSRGIDTREQLRRVVACRGAIKAGAFCTLDQCRNLLDQLARTRNPFTCPHGRPTMIVFRKQKMDELFKRV